MIRGEGSSCFIANDFCLATLMNAMKSNGIEKAPEKHRRTRGKKPETVIGAARGWGDNGGKGDVGAKTPS